MFGIVTLGLAGGGGDSAARDEEGGAGDDEAIRFIVRSFRDRGMRSLRQ
jgi:hypothetical protein